MKYIKEEILENIIGMSKDDCLSIIAQYNFRMIIDQEDKEKYITTCDYCLDRVRLHIKNGKIIKASIG